MLFWSVFSVHGMSESRSMEYSAFFSPHTDWMEAWHSRGASCAWPISDLPSGFFLLILVLPLLCFYFSPVFFPVNFVLHMACHLSFSSPCIFFPS